MYVEYPLIIQPSDENIKVWRYMSFTKVVSCLTIFSRHHNKESMFCFHL
jgi:hypothetical protein